MKARLILILLIAAALSACNDDPADIKIITFNIRYDNPSDGINAWPNRRNMVVEFLERQEAGLFGLQEALWNQYIYIDSSLVDWGSVAVGRNDGQREGEMTPIFYRRDLFDLEESSTFWLSETPGVPGSRGWGAVLPRIVTWANLTRKDDGSSLYYFNTHFSHMSDSARIMSSKVLRKEVIRIAGENDFIITGDFNMLPDSRAYSELVQAPFLDSYLAPGITPGGVTFTFNGFNDNTGDGRIDYVFVRDGLEVLSHTTMTIKNDPVFISDHWPVIVTVRLGSLK